MNSNIRGERARAGLTLKQLASELDVSERTIRNWESKTSLPSPGPLLKMSDLFGCTTDYLLGRTDERTAGRNGRD